MKPKVICKIIIDILMTCALLFLMGYQFWGDVAHEWIGAGMFLGFILHHILNRRWYLSLFRGRRTPVHIISAALDLLLFLIMLGLMGSAVLLSNHVFCVFESSWRDLLCQTSAYGSVPLGIRTDGPASWDALGDVCEAGRKSAASDAALSCAAAPSSVYRARESLCTE